MQQLPRRPLLAAVAAGLFAPAIVRAQGARTLRGDIASFVQYAKVQANPLRYGTNGTGSVSHLFGILMTDAMGIRLTDVAYRGSGPSTTDLLAGVIEIGVEAPRSPSSTFGRESCACSAFPLTSACPFCRTSRPSRRRDIRSSTHPSGPRSWFRPARRQRTSRA
jgi:hypothetical protein